MTETTTLDVTSPIFRADPYPIYARLRARMPVQRITLSGKQTAWLVTRYDDVLEMLKGKHFAKDRLNALPPEQTAKQPWVPKFVKPLMRNMLDVDAPDHTRLKALVHMAFTPRIIERMEQRIQSLADELLDKALSRGQMDLIRDYALPIPTTIIAEMLGVPAKDNHKFTRWSSAIVAIESPSPRIWDMAKALPHLVAFLKYIRRLIRAQAAAPQDNLIGALVQAEEAGAQLDEDELVAMVFLLLVAGHETTVNLIGNGTLALLNNPDQMERLVKDPGLIESAVEELLRYDGPLKMATERYAREDVTIAGTTIPQGELVFAGLASANRDERQFPDPERLDLAREPNRHLAFGQGVHYCLGAPLARLEGQIALNTLLRRARNLRLAIAPEKLRWKRGLVLRSLKALPVSFD